MPFLPNIAELTGKLEAAHSQDVARQERIISLLEAILVELKRR